MRADPNDSPARNPTAYPGDIPDHSYLLYGERYVRIETSPDRRLPKALVHELTSDIVGEAGHGRCLPLNFVLLRLNAATMNQRVPVLSVGSNAAPAQLALKFRSREVNAVVPVIRARVQGLGIAYSAHLNAHGYLPAAPVGTDGEPLNALIAFLDDEQLNAVDDSEPNYTRVGISRATYPVVLDSGEEIERCCLHRGRHGIVESAAAAFGPFFDPTAMTPQRAVFDELLGGDPRLTRRLGVESYDDLLRRAPELATIFTEVLVDAGLRADDRVRTVDPADDAAVESAARTYGEPRPCCPPLGRPCAPASRSSSCPTR